MRARRIAVAAGLAAALAACASSSKSSQTVKPVSLKVGLLYTTAGVGGDFAQAALGAANLAVKTAGQAKVTIEIVEADYAGELKTVAAAAESLASKSDAIVVATDDADVAPLLAGVRDRPMIHALITSDGAIAGRSNAFRVAPSNQFQAETIASYLVRTRTYERVAIISDTTAFGREGSTDLAAAFARAGATPVLSTSFTPGGDIHTPVMAAGGRRAQAVVIWAESPGEAGRIVVEAHRMAQSYQIVLSGNLATATFAKNASAQVTPVAFRDGMLSVGTWAGPWFSLRRIVGFYRDFQTANSALAPPQATAVYDAVLALAAAARNEGTSPDAIIAGLESLNDFEGAGVPLTFASGKHEGIDLDDMGILGYTKNQDSAGGEFFPEVDTGGGFFTILADSLELPEKYRFLTTKV